MPVVLFELVKQGRREIKITEPELHFCGKIGHKENVLLWVLAEGEGIVYKCKGIFVELFLSIFLDAKRGSQVLKQFILKSKFD